MDLQLKWVRDVDQNSPYLLDEGHGRIMLDEERSRSFRDFGTWLGEFAWRDRYFDLSEVAYDVCTSNDDVPDAVELTSMFDLAEDEDNAGMLVIETDPEAPEILQEDLVWESAFDQAEWHLDDAFRTLVNVAEVGRRGMDSFDRDSCEAHLDDGQIVRLGRGFTETLIRLRTMLPELGNAVSKRSGHLEATDTSHVYAPTVAMDRRWLDDLSHGIELLIG